MNQYGLPLSAPIAQTIIPAMNQSGIVYGFYPITKTTFAGTETSFVLPDTTVPITTVTVDSLNGITQYMAAVFPLGIAANSQPWASASLIAPGNGAYRWFSQATETWMLHFNAGTLLTALAGNMAPVVSAPASPSAPTVAPPQALTFNGSVKYNALNGQCNFFDFNWINLFTATQEQVPLSITVVSNPAPIGSAPVSPMVDTIRLVKLADEVPAGVYAFVFSIANVSGLSTTVTLNLTVA